MKYDMLLRCYEAVRRCKVILLNSVLVGAGMGPVNHRDREPLKWITPVLIMNLGVGGGGGHLIYRFTSTLLHLLLFCIMWRFLLDSCAMFCAFVPSLDLFVQSLDFLSIASGTVV